MATAQTIVDRALRIVLGVESTGTSAEQAIALTALNAMIDSWRTERLMTYSTSTVSLALTVSDSSYTIGSGGDFNTTRPVEIISAYTRDSGTNSPVLPLTTEEWDAIAVKSVTSDIVTHYYYNPTMSTGTINVYPVPSATNTLYLTLRTPLTGFSALSDTVTLPPGWERALAYNLAIEVAPEFAGAVLTQDTYLIARDSKAMIKRSNNFKMKMVPENAVIFNNHTTNILTDE